MLNNKYKGHNFILKIILVILIVIFIPQIAHARAGLSTSWGEVILRNVAIGLSYNTRELLNLPLRVTNTGDMSIDIQVEIIAPGAGSLKDDYEVIPSTGWIKLGQEYFTIAPKENAVTDVIISIPDDEKYLGKKYQFHIYSHSTGSVGFMGLGLMSRVLLNIAPVRADVTPEEISQLKANLNFSVTPQTIYATVELDRNYNLEKLTGKAFKLVNPNDETYSYKITSMDPKKTIIIPSKGYEICPDPSFLRIIKPKLKVSANGIKKIKMHLKIPYKEEHIGKKYMFVVYIEVLKQDIPVGKYSMVYVTVEE